VAYTRTYRTIVPVEPDANLEVLRWLARESFEKTAVSDGLRMVAWNEAEIPSTDLPPKAAKQLGKPLSDFRFYEFTGQATNEPEV